MKKSVNYLNSIDSATKAGFLFLTLIIFPLIIAVSLKIISGATLHY
jgi:nitrate reductase NapE component